VHQLATEKAELELLRDIPTYVKIKLSGNKAPCKVAFSYGENKTLKDHEVTVFSSFTEPLPSAKHFDKEK